MDTASCGYITDITEKIFSLRSVESIENFVDGLNLTDPFAASVAFLVRSWNSKAQKEGRETIEPATVLAQDLSAAIQGDFPVVFMGTNAWATKPYLEPARHMESIDRFLNHLTQVVSCLGDRPVVLAVVPEKDYVIDRYFLNSGRFAAIDAAMSHLRDACDAMKVRLIYNGYIDGLRAWENPEDFTYRDTHLTWRHYQQIFAEIVVALGANWNDIAPHFTLSDRLVFGDLQSKFSGHKPLATIAKALTRDEKLLTIVAGTKSFAEPLGSTWQLISNSRPLRRNKVLVLGDSHSSILSMNNLTYLLASTFESCEFRWNPAAIREAVVSTDADAVIMEISQRFIM